MTGMPAAEGVRDGRADLRPDAADLLPDAADLLPDAAAFARAVAEFAESAAFALLPVPAWVFDLASLRFLAVNEAALDRYGWSRSEFLAMTIADIRPEEDVAAARDAVEDPDFGNGPPARSEWRHLHADGRIIPVEIFVRRFDLAG